MRYKQKLREKDLFILRKRWQKGDVAASRYFIEGNAQGQNLEHGKF